MTEVEAIKIFNDLLDVPCEMLVKYDSVINSEKKQALVRLRTAEEIAINALEKQIPKKPDCIEDKMYCCPVCDNNLMYKWIKYPTRLMPKTEGLPHCMSCGQKIDWSDGE